MNHTAYNTSEAFLEVRTIFVHWTTSTANSKYELDVMNWFSSLLIITNSEWGMLLLFLFMWFARDRKEFFDWKFPHF